MNFKDYNILVVDDHFLIRQMVSETLGKAGITSIDCVSSGASALEKIKTTYDSGSRYHIVFLDWAMPEMSGFKVLKLCRTDSRYDEMAIVMVSAESEDSKIVTALEAGATAYVTKPFKPETLFKLLENIAAWRENKSHAVKI